MWNHRPISLCPKLPHNQPCYTQRLCKETLGVFCSILSVEVAQIIPTVFRALELTVIKDVGAAALCSSILRYRGHTALVYPKGTALGPESELVRTS